MKDLTMKNKPATTCSTCLNFADIGEGRECLNLVSFKQPHEVQFRSATANDSCPDHDARVVTMYSHPDNHSAIKLEIIPNEGGDYGVLIVTGKDGSTVSVPVGPIGLIELGLDLARHGKQMLE